VGFSERTALLAVHAEDEEEGDTDHGKSGVHHDQNASLHDLQARRDGH